MSELEEDVYGLRWNNNMAVIIITVVSYDYMLQFEKEVKYVWERQWSLMSYLYLAVSSAQATKVLNGFYVVVMPGFAPVGEVSCICLNHRKRQLPFAAKSQLSLTSYLAASISSSTENAFAHHPIEIGHGIILLVQWGLSTYFCLAEVILIWRLYALYNRSKLLLNILLGLFMPIVALYIGMNIFLYSRPSAFSVEEIITPTARYCVASFHMGPMPAIYASIPVICYDILLVALAVAILMKHLKEQRELKRKPNTYVLMIVQYHIIYFVLNLASQIFSAILWANLPVRSPMILERSALKRTRVDVGVESGVAVQ
ncbi:hypothetical protein DFH29DRAFT_1000794 [Suillus ampliporus]|nr:hypothetical protein DFH29DRAFT_1000794 [Suillus ampliporus]